GAAMVYWLSLRRRRELGPLTEGDSQTLRV
ncbi:MAG: hypothetical protein RL376_1866, partial [Verrucomicrobiota bacterium]